MTTRRETETELEHAKKGLHRAAGDTPNYNTGMPAATGNKTKGGLEKQRIATALKMLTEIGVPHSPPIDELDVKRFGKILGVKFLRQSS